MAKRYAYFYFMKREPAKIQATVPAHVLEGYQGGPFADRSGGLIIFGADNIEEATGVIADEPFVMENLLEEKWIKEWMVE